MVRVKMLKDAERVSMNGMGGELLYAKEGEVLEVTERQSKGLIKSEYIVITTEDITESPEDSDDDVFGLTPENKAFILDLQKNDIETILRLYGVEVDKRQNMDSIRKLLAETVSQALPDDVEDNEGLAVFYNAIFEVQLDLVSYDEGDSTAMAESMGKILTEALEVEDS